MEFYAKTINGLGGGLKYVLFSPRKLRKSFHLTCAYFSNGLVQPPTSISLPSDSWDGFSPYQHLMMEDVVLLDFDSSKI